MNAGVGAGRKDLLYYFTERQQKNPDIMRPLDVHIEANSAVYASFYLKRLTGPGLLEVIQLQLPYVQSFITSSKTPNAMPNSGKSWTTQRKEARSPSLSHTLKHVNSRTSKRSSAKLSGFVRRWRCPCHDIRPRVVLPLQANTSRRQSKLGVTHGLFMWTRISLEKTQSNSILRDGSKARNVIERWRSISSLSAPGAGLVWERISLLW